MEILTDYPVIFALLVMIFARSFRQDMMIGRLKDEVRSLKREVTSLREDRLLERKKPSRAAMPEPKEEPRQLPEPREEPVPHLDAVGTGGSTVAVPALVEDALDRH